LIGRGYPLDNVPGNIDGSPPGGVLLRVVGPDGNEVYAAGGLLNGDAFVVPADGQYTFIFQPYGRGKSSATIWDYADAPADVQAQSPGGHPTCTYERNSQSCSSSSYGPGVDSGIGATPVCTPEMKAKPEFKQLCEQLGATASTYVVGPSPTMAVPLPTVAVAPPPLSNGSGSSSETTAVSVPHG
jgi:hypothetical protein